MNKKVSIRELVATKIIFVVLLAGYYWMWSRTDWKPYYQTLQGTWGTFLILFIVIQSMRIRKYKKEGVDELAEKNLRRCDALCLKILVVAMFITAYIGGILGHVDAISTSTMGWIIIATIFVVSIFRTIVFIIMDTKGI